MAAVGPAAPARRALVMGLLTACLPCGWLYAFVVAAAGTGSPLGGAGLMAVFWLGTLPVMVGLGVGVRALARPLGRLLPVGCAVAMIVVGLLAVAGRVGAPELSHAPRAPAGAHGRH
jgi:sulfite exporter TauE/SafE